MKKPGRIISILAILSITTLLLAPTLFAASSPERPEDATPPYGLKVEGDAKGTKLNGAIMVEFYMIEKSFQQVPPILGGANCRGEIIDPVSGLCCGGAPDTMAHARLVLRLRQGSEGKNLYTYYAEIGPVPLSGDPSDIQMAIQNDSVLKKAILEDFFGVTEIDSMTISLRNFSEFGIIAEDIETVLTGKPGPCTWFDIDADPGDQCTEQDCGGSRFVLADVVIAVR